MAVYKVVDHNLVPVIQHIESYKLKITNMTSSGIDYIITTDGPITDSEVVHLYDSYGLMEVV